MTCIGIDVSKERLDICVANEDATFTYLQCSNTTEAFKALADVWGKDSRVVMEATGGYEKTAVQVLQSLGIWVCVANPLRVKHFARSKASLAKTDKQDSRILALYLSKSDDELRPAPIPQNPELSELCDYRQSLLELKVRTRQQLLQAGPTVKPLLEEDLKTFKEKLAKVETEITRLVSAYSEASVLNEVSGVGPQLTATLLAFLPELGKVNHREVAALVGVAPFDRQSGKTKGKAFTFGGRSHIRTVLYMAANSARQHNPLIKAFYERLREKGKPFKVALVACMRKLLAAPSLLRLQLSRWGPLSCLKHSAQALRFNAKIRDHYTELLVA
jgi:transposase